MNQNYSHLSGRCWWKELLKLGFERRHGLVHRGSANQRVDDETEQKRQDRIQVDGHGPDDLDSAILLRKREHMRDISKARIVGNEPKQMGRLILRNPNCIQSILLNGGFAAGDIFLAHGNRTRCDRFDFQLSVAPFRVTGNVGYIIKGELPRDIDRNLV